MTPQEFAAMLDGREYGSELSREEEALAKQLNLVVIHGYSDDNVELRGAIDEEIGAYDGTKFEIDSKGLRRKWKDIEDPSEKEAEEYFARKSLTPISIKAEWCKEEPYSWTISTNLVDSSRFASFDIKEDGEPFCRGLVISLGTSSSN